MTILTPSYLIEGGEPLHGTAQISGAKNAVTKMVIATLLTADLCTLRNVPLIGDFDLTLALCRDMGAEIVLQDHILTICTPNINSSLVSSEVGGLNRMAILAVGPLLHRCGEADIPMLGGDRIGLRPIDFHINGLKAMGAEVTEEQGRSYFHNPRGLHGATIALPFPSVMATENFLITAALARGVTVIENAAMEPEITDLIKLLQKMGAIIEIKIDRRIVIEGVERLHGASHTLVSDRNEAVSLAIAAYLTKGDVYLRGAQQDTLLT
ncbi:MAG: UDP-N-acetylglucosamine 1-carboxyvinyltransferase, partial [Ktedonobacteraceae bacterium]